MTEYLDGPCHGCGECVTREKMDGSLSLAAMVNSLPLWCSACVETDHKAALEDARRSELAREEGIRLFRTRNSGLPAKHLETRLEDLDHSTAILDAARNWADHGGGLLLTGGIGRGKTTIAGAAAARRLELKRVRWTSAPLLFARLGSGFGSDQREWALSLLESRGGLVLDDIDKARPTEYGAEQLFLAVDQRVENRDPLLVTSNLAPSQLAEKWPEPYGEAIASRLVGYCKVCQVQGVDRRLELRRVG